MATFIRTVNGKLQYEIEPGSPVTMGPNIPTEQAVISAAAAAAAAAEAAEAAAEQAMSGTPEGYADLVGSVAETYSSLDTYQAGDYVLHESALYQAVVDIDTAEEWTADHWEAVTVGGELTELAEGIDGAEAAAASGMAALRTDIDTNTAAIKGAVLTEEKEVYYPFESGDSRYSTSARVFWPEEVPAGSLLTEVRVYIGNLGTGPEILVDIWEVSEGTLTKIRSIRKTDISANQLNVIPVMVYAEKPLMVCFNTANCNGRYYRKNQTGYKFKYTAVTSEDTQTIAYTDLSTFNNMKLIGGFAYRTQDLVTHDFFSGYLTGNIIVFGDSTVDGSSVTDHTENVIGTDRSAASEPYVFTSILENMIRTFNGSETLRVYNAGFGGKTLNYIADNYSAIMAAFSNVKSALLVIDANSANAGEETRADYAASIRSGLERMIKLLKNDGIAPAIASPQPMFFYPADDEGLPALNSAGEFGIAVNIGKDIAAQYGLPFIDLGGITNKVMESPFFTSAAFFGDRVHFGDGGHKFEAYELYGELIHPIIYYDGGKKLIRVESNQCELSEDSGISATLVNGYRSIVLQATHTRTDVLARFYLIALTPVKLGGVVMDWAYNADMYVNGELYTEGVATLGAALDPGAYEITIKPEAEKIVRFSGLMIDTGEV